MLTLALYSCNKTNESDPVSCWHCTVKTVAMIDTLTNTTHDTLCDRTKAQIDAHVKAGNWQIGGTSTGVPYGSFYASGYSSMTTGCAEIR